MRNKDMANDVNKVTLTGRLGAAPDIKRTKNGKKFAMLNLATGESWKNAATGEYDKKTKWTRVIVWNEECATFIEHNFEKGSHVEVNGKLEDTEWVSDGEPRRGTQVTVNSANGVRASANFADGVKAVKDDAKPAPKDRATPKASTPRAAPRNTVEEDSDIPF